MTSAQLRQAWDLDMFVPGRPAPKGSTRAFVRGGRAVTVADNRETQREWASYVRDGAAAAMQSRQALYGAALGREGGPTGAPVAISVEFVMPRRASAPKRSTPAHTRKPDLDKLLRTVLDALTHVVWLDDAQVVDGAISKREAEIGEAPGARIRVALL